jgi:hypothetical protein
MIDNGIVDPDIENFEFTSLRREGEEYVKYHHLAERMVELHDELENPSPRGRLAHELERWRSPRRAILVAMVGVAIAVFLGLLTLAITCYQTWITYQAWQHPVSS